VYVEGSPVRLMDPFPVFKFPLWQDEQFWVSPWYPFGGLLELLQRAEEVIQAKNNKKKKILTL
jgi:hypothetical protein